MLGRVNINKNCEIFQIRTVTYENEEAEWVPPSIKLFGAENRKLLLHTSRTWNFNSIVLNIILDTTWLRVLEIALFGKAMGLQVAGNNKVKRIDTDIIIIETILLCTGALSFFL